MAPVASTEHLGVKDLRVASNHFKVLEFALVHVLGHYNWFETPALGSEALDTFCVLESQLCTNFMSELIDSEINNVERYEMMV